MNPQAGLRRLPPAVVDPVLAVVVTGVTVWGAYAESNPSDAARAILRGYTIKPAPWWAYLLVIASGLVLIWRRRHPRITLGVSLAGVFVFTMLGYVGYATLIIPPIALYTLALTASMREAILFGLGTLLVLAAIIAAGPKEHLTSGDLGLAGLVVVALLAGVAGANRRRYIDAVRTRAELIERTQQEEARRVVDAERLRIARELHDVVAHTMATINVQAGVAAYVAGELPPPAADALQAIKTASKDGLRELRAILAVLRQADDPESNQPQPGLSRLDALVAGVTAAGLPTEIVITGRPPSVLPAAVDLAVYRIVQESLTNSIRHAGPATATVQVSYGRNEVRLSITDTGGGPASPESPAGHGLVGMRERAAAVGGDLKTGPAGGGGFQVTARLPLGGTR